jgi:hypothetical protein
VKNATSPRCRTARISQLPFFFNILIAMTNPITNSVTQYPFIVLLWFNYSSSRRRKHILKTTFDYWTIGFLMPQGCTVSCENHLLPLNPSGFSCLRDAQFCKNYLRLLNPSGFSCLRHVQSPVKSTFDYLTHRFLMPQGCTVSCENVSYMETVLETEIYCTTAHIQQTRKSQNTIRNNKNWSLI